MAKKIIVQDGILFVGTSDSTYEVNMTVAGSMQVTGTGAIKLPVGTTATRPTVPATADIRYNTDTPGFEYYNGTIWQPLLSVTGYAVLIGGNQFTGAQSTGFTTLAYASTITINATTSNNYRVVLTGNTLFANPTGLSDGQEIYLLIYQDGAGNRLATFSSMFEFVGGNIPVLSTGANYVDLLYGVYDATQGKFVCELTSLSGSGGGATGATGATGPSGGGTPTLNFVPISQPNYGTSNYTPLLTDINSVTIVSRDSIPAQPIIITISPHSTTAWPTGCSLQGIQEGTQQVTIVGTGGVIINCAFPLNSTRAQYSPWAAQYMGSDVWQLYGDLK